MKGTKKRQRGWNEEREEKERGTKTGGKNGGNDGDGNRDLHSSPSSPFHSLSLTPTLPASLPSVTLPLLVSPFNPSFVLSDLSPPLSLFLSLSLSSAFFPSAPLLSSLSPSFIPLFLLSHSLPSPSLTSSLHFSPLLSLFISDPSLSPRLSLYHHFLGNTALHYTMPLSSSAIITQNSLLRVNIQNSPCPSCTPLLASTIALRILRMQHSLCKLGSVDIPKDKLYIRRVVLSVCCSQRLE